MGRPMATPPPQHTQWGRVLTSIPELGVGGGGCAFRHPLASWWYAQEERGSQRKAP